MVISPISNEQTCYRFKKKKTQRLRCHSAGRALVLHACRHVFEPQHHTHREDENNHQTVCMTVGSLGTQTQCCNTCQGIRLNVQSPFQGQATWWRGGRGVRFGVASDLLSCFSFARGMKWSWEDRCPNALFCFLSQPGDTCLPRASSVGNKATSQGQLLNPQLISTFYFLRFVYLQISTCLKTFINTPNTLSAQNHSPHSTDGKNG